MSNPAAQDRIKQAFLKLVEEQPYSKITIVAIAEELKMTRQNIYHYYSSKDEIFADIVEDGLDAVYTLIEQADPNLDDESFNKLVELGAELLYRDKRLNSALIKSGEHDTIHRLSKVFLLRCLGRIARIQGITIRDTAYLELVATQLAGGIYFLFKAWVENDMEMPPQKVAKIAQAYSGSALLGLLKECE